MKTTSLLVLLCVVAVCMARPKPRPADEYEYDEEPAPAPKPAARANPLLRRNPLNRGGAKSTTTTTTPAPIEDEEPIEEGELEEEVEEQPVTTTTEATKKLRAGIVRPFRSNDDLLAALKRRREQAGSGKGHAAKVNDNADSDQAREEAATPAPKRASSGRKNRFNAAPKADEQEADAAPAAAPSRSGRGRFSARA
ncbi:hypothetical protein CBL_05835 [Carabus blaptoides fortunei]